MLISLSFPATRLFIEIFLSNIYLKKSLDGQSTELRREAKKHLLLPPLKNDSAVWLTDQFLTSRNSDGSD